MNSMKKTTGLVYLSLMLLPVSVSAAVFECKDSRGHTVYRQEGGRGCTAVDIRNTGTFTTVPAYTAPATTDSYTPPEVSPAPDNRLQSAEQDLAAARKALEEGKKVRYGNERNYAKYLERIKGLEDAVKAKEAAVQQLQ